MDVLLIVLCAGSALYGFFRSALGRDLLKTAAKPVEPPPEPELPVRSKPPSRKERFGGRDTFGLRRS